MPDELLLNEAAYAVWQTVKDRGPIELGEVAKLTGIDQAQVSAAATEASQRGFFQIEQREREDLIKTAGADELLRAGLPEIRAAKHLASVGGSLPMQDFIAWANSAAIAPNEVLKWGASRQWIEKAKSDRGTAIILTDLGKRALENAVPDVDIMILSADQSPIPFDALELTAEARERIRSLLAKRPELAKFKARTERTLSLTNRGAKAFQTARQVIERNTLTPEDLESGAWREIKLRPYDVKLAAKDAFPAKIHPLRKIIEQTRRAFLEMGFAEVVSPMVESAFWNFDALFQPQDHPAREMQDTFYMRHPATAPLPGEEKSPSPTAPGFAGGSSPSPQPPAPSPILENVRRTHENGWATGSEGWGYTWSPKRSKQVVLRTHTTAATIRALAANPNPPGKVFCVGWTYRNETI
ncbi:MAG TPA: hypothetical protein VHU84_10910, partial [Lacipirellulaceae bacterium]|nr:hypothetical protein [Lacipirellulaceae bacterium]